MAAPPDPLLCIEVARRKTRHNLQSALPQPSGSGSSMPPSADGAIRRPESSIWQALSTRKQIHLQPVGAKPGQHPPMAGSRSAGGLSRGPIPPGRFWPPRSHPTPPRLRGCRTPAWVVGGNPRPTLGRVAAPRQSRVGSNRAIARSHGPLEPSREYQPYCVLEDARIVGVGHERTASRWTKMLTRHGVVPKPATETYLSAVGWPHFNYNRVVIV